MHLPYISTRDPWDCTLGFIGLILGPPVIYLGLSWIVGGLCPTVPQSLLPVVPPATEGTHPGLESGLLSAINDLFIFLALVWALCTVLNILTAIGTGNQRAHIRFRQGLETSAIAFSLAALALGVTALTQCISTGGGAI